ncbi:MAG TPA: tRNA (N6-isopentenyl adenosine(37)-C2)-methylthiotransferase MiaB [Deltaproteobacteria bacterium]|nr:tRNA (N6-isopentenyl adenosine(37)-C2)-methylthiotransferase MiaB [Deltaproteobacteria bacterium]
MGCQMNEYDSDFLAQSLISEGYKRTDTPDQADLVLVNTCAVRAKPEQKTFSFLGRMSALKKKKPDMVLGVVGCLAQMKGNNILKQFHLLDFAIGPRDLNRIMEVLQKIENNQRRIAAVSLDSFRSGSVSCPGYFAHKITGFISIMEGCNNFCSYCIVPYVRGREISKPVDDILGEAHSLISQGVKEITLLGQNVNSYNWKQGNRRWRFPDLLKRLGGVEGLVRLRFTTSHPKDVSLDLIQSFKDIPTLCSHIHLPFQAGSNQILKSMKRRYTREDYMKLVENLRNVNPGIAITSDVMVGFPGETDNDFKETIDLIRHIRFDSLYSFKYSDRTGTAAEKMGNKVVESVKTSRLTILQDLQEQITREKNRKLEGQVFVVLIEGESRKGGQKTGKTDTNKIVNFQCDKSSAGELVMIRIRQAFINSFRGEIEDLA